MHVMDTDNTKHGEKLTCHKRSRAMGLLNLWLSRRVARLMRVSPPTPKTNAAAPSSILLSDSRINSRLPDADG